MCNAAEEDDVEQAKTLLQGAIHEYDRFMRQRPEEDRNSEFHRCGDPPAAPPAPTAR